MSTPHVDPLCKNCTYWHSHVVEDTGYCHRNAPVVTLGNSAETRWPFTLSRESCGDFYPDVVAFGG